MTAWLAFSLVLTSVALAQDPPPPEAVDPALSARAEAYYDAEDVLNGVYVGLGVLNLGAGAYAVAAHGDEGLAFGIPLLTFGTVQAVVGVTYLLLTPSWRAGVRSAALETERIGPVAAGFPIYLAVEATIALTGFGTVLAGSMLDDPLAVAAGGGMLLGGAVQMAIELCAAYVGWDYLKDLSLLPDAQGAQIMWRVSF